MRQIRLDRERGSAHPAAPRASGKRPRRESGGARGREAAEGRTGSGAARVEGAPEGVPGGGVWRARRPWRSLVQGREKGGRGEVGDKEGKPGRKGARRADLAARSGRRPDGEQLRLRRECRRLLAAAVHGGSCGNRDTKRDKQQRETTAGGGKENGERWLGARRGQRGRRS